ncbi:Gag-pro-like protein [Theobroma cacao]|uniref:Gag-pro-like protein n=1 Tax=Theobroma cacao TaxID=3641 RepID=A0A061ELG5_THECC|nr:Gag-pro-like protein [Theobroma cacao]
MMGITPVEVDQNLRKKGDNECIPWSFLRSYIMKHRDTEQGQLVMALGIYGLVIFPKVLGHIEVGIIDFFEQVINKANHSPSILAETLRSLNYCQRKCEGRFVGCAQLLSIWIVSHFECKLCLVPDVLIPAKFKVPEFEKYDGTKCPMTHITMYCRKMAAQSHDDKLLIHFFQDSLTGSAARWYVQLNRNRIKTWKDLARAFIAQYKHVAELAPDRLSLQTMEKKQSENFKEYAQRWRDTAAGKIAGHEAASSKKGSTPKKKEGDVQAVTHDSQQAHNFNPNYPYPPYQPFYPNIGNIAQNPYVYQLVPQPTFQTNALPQTPPQKLLASTNNPGHGQRGPKTTLERPKFDPISVPYTTLLPQLIENRLLARTPLEPLRPPFPKWYDPNAHCDYHFGIQGHSTENCTTLKHKVQALIKAGLLNFAKKDNSSVDGNPLPNHGRSTVNAIHEGMIRRVKKGIDEIQTPMDKVFEALSKINAITPEPIDTEELGHDLAYSCKFHMGAIGHSIQNCDSFRRKLQELMDSSVIEFYEEVEENLVGTINGDTPTEVASSSFKGNKPKPLTIFYEENRSPMNDTFPTMIRSGITIEVPSPFPYKSDKAVPWNYECNILGTASSSPQASLEDLTSVGGITRSGRCYSPEIAERVGKGNPA